MLIECITRLWNHIGEGEVTNIADYAAQHHKEAHRPLRIAVDTACWIYNNVTKEQTREIEKVRSHETCPALGKPSIENADGVVL
jgi:holliday junction resolvase YEN1